MKYGFRNAEKKDLADLVVFDCAQQGKTLEEVLRTEGFVSYELEDAFDLEFQTTNIDEIINYDPTYTISGHYGAKIKMYREDGSFVEVSMYNITTEPMTIAECVAAGQFYIGDNNDVSSEYSGKNAFDLEEEYSIAYLEKLIEMLGKPDAIYYSLNITMNTDREGEETFAETVRMGGGDIVYDLMYQMEDAKLFVSIIEFNSYNEYNLDNVSVCYCTDDLYVFLRDETNSGALVNEEKVYAFE